MPVPRLTQNLMRHQRRYGPQRCENGWCQRLCRRNPSTLAARCCTLTMAPSMIRYPKPKSSAKPLKLLKKPANGCLRPVRKALVHRVQVAELRRWVAPRRFRAREPQNRIDKRRIVSPRYTPVDLLARHQIIDPSSLSARQSGAIHPRPFQNRSLEPRIATISNPFNFPRNLIRVRNSQIG